MIGGVGRPGDIDVVIKENDVRRFGRNIGALQRSLGKHQHLGRKRNVELAKHGEQVTEAFVVFQGTFPAGDPVLEAGRPARRA